ncbi:MAG TPA: hypothetical protein V6D09_06035 [Leptolyngbyaceae cyanobacterium]
MGRVNLKSPQFDTNSSTSLFAGSKITPLDGRCFDGTSFKPTALPSSRETRKGGVSWGKSPTEWLQNPKLI